MWSRSLDLRGLSSADCLDLTIGLLVSSCVFPAYFLRRKTPLSPKKVERWLEIVILLILCPVIRSRLVTYFVSRQFYLRGYRRLLFYIVLGIFLRETIEVRPEGAVRVAETIAFAAMYLVSKEEEKKRIQIFLKASLGWPLSFSAVTGPWTFLLLAVVQVGWSIGFSPDAGPSAPDPRPRTLALPPPSFPQRGLRPCLCTKFPLQSVRGGAPTSLSAQYQNDAPPGALVLAGGTNWALAVLELSLIHI